MQPQANTNIKRELQTHKATKRGRREPFSSTLAAKPSLLMLGHFYTCYFLTALLYL